MSTDFSLNCHPLFIYNYITLYNCYYKPSLIKQDIIQITQSNQLTLFEWVDAKVAVEFLSPFFLINCLLHDGVQLDHVILLHLFSSSSSGHLAHCLDANKFLDRSTELCDNYVTIGIDFNYSTLL